MNDRDYSEKRTYMRMELDAPATIELADGSQHDCTCSDLSAVGMKLMMDRPLTLGDEIKVHVPAFSNQFSPLDARTAVTRVDDVGDGRYSMGVEIIKMT
ncbi:MAG: PilZ domain-containing protein [Natronospirillum sp.]